MAESVVDVDAPIAELASRWRADLGSRQSRRELHRADFDVPRDTGLLALPAPLADGGAWAGIERSSRPIGGIHRTLAAADASVALVYAAGLE